METLWIQRKLVSWRNGVSKFMPQHLTKCTIAVRGMEGRLKGWFEEMTNVIKERKSAGGFGLMQGWKRLLCCTLKFNTIAYPWSVMYTFNLWNLPHHIRCLNLPCQLFHILLNIPCLSFPEHLYMAFKELVWTCYIQPPALCASGKKARRNS